MLVYPLVPRYGLYPGFRSLRRYRLGCFPASFVVVARPFVLIRTKVVFVNARVYLLFSIHILCFLLIVVLVESILVLYLSHARKKGDSETPIIHTKSGKYTPRIGDPGWLRSIPTRRRICQALSLLLSSLYRHNTCL
jgi:hypothetical protein